MAWMDLKRYGTAVAVKLQTRLRSGANLWLAISGQVLGGVLGGVFNMDTWHRTKWYAQAGDGITVQVTVVRASCRNKAIVTFFISAKLWLITLCIPAKTNTTTTSQPTCTCTRVPVTLS